MVNYDGFIVYIGGGFELFSLLQTTTANSTATMENPRQAREVFFQRQISRCPCAWAADGQMSAMAQLFRKLVRSEKPGRIHTPPRN